jgi:hypothetical protein
MDKDSRQVEVTQEDIRIIKHDVSKLTSTLEKVHNALVGSELGKDGGIVERLVQAEKELDVIKDKVDVMEIERGKERLKTDIYRKITFFLSGTVAAAIIGAIIKHYM